MMIYILRNGSENRTRVQKFERVEKVAESENMNLADPGDDLVDRVTLHK